MRNANRVGSNELVNLLKKQSGLKTKSDSMFTDPFVLVSISVESLCLILYGLFAQYDPVSSPFNHYTDFLNVQIMVRVWLVFN